MKTLDEIGLGYRTDKSSPYHNYLNTYEKYFKEFRDVPGLVLWELGIGDINSANREGESAFVWRDYFNCSPAIYAIDNDPIKIEQLSKEKNVYTRCIDQTDSYELPILAAKVQPFIVIDDASHHLENTIASFEIIFPLLQAGGIYCIEDVVAPAYWPSWGGQAGIFDSNFMNYFHNLTHCINLQKQHNFQIKIDIGVIPWIKQIESIHFHHSQIIIRKK